MKNSMNIALTTNWGIQIQNLLADVLLKADDGKDPKNSDRPKVTKIIEPAKPSHDFRPVMNNERPKVTSVKAKKKNREGQEDDFIYDFTFYVDMDGYSGAVTIDIQYGPSEVLSFIYEDVNSTETKLTGKKTSNESIFGNPATGNYTFHVELLKGLLVTMPRPTPTDEAPTEFINDTTTSLSFGQKISRFFRRIFGKK